MNCPKCSFLLSDEMLEMRVCYNCGQTIETKSIEDIEKERKKEEEKQQLDEHNKKLNIIANLK